MSIDITDAMVEQARRERVNEINFTPGSREDLEQKYGKVWTLSELSEEYTILGFGAPFVVVKRRIDGQKGSFEFQHNPRFYFNFQPDSK